MNNDASKILQVDDDPNILKALARVLKDYGTTTATSGAEALLIAKTTGFDMVISDYRMPEMDGVVFLEKFMAIQPDAVRVILTGYAELEALQKAVKKIGIFRFINKPWNNLEITNAIEKAMEMKIILLENKALADQVRRQQALLHEQEAILKALEAEDPGITKVNWAPDGSSILDKSDFDD